MVLFVLIALEALAVRLVFHLQWLSFLRLSWWRRSSRRDSFGSRRSCFFGLWVSEFPQNCRIDRPSLAQRFLAKSKRLQWVGVTTGLRSVHPIFTAGNCPFLPISWAQRADLPTGCSRVIHTSFEAF